MSAINNIMCIFSVIIIFLLGIYLSLKTRFLQLKLLPLSLKNMFFSLKDNKKNNNSKISSSEAMCTALAATIGTGNIAGISGAIALGGAGVIFWIWVSTIFAMIIKYFEIYISLLYRQRTPEGNAGGTMYAVKYGLKKIFLPLSFLFAFCGVVASFGTGNFIQINTVVSSVKNLFPSLDNSNLYCGTALALFIGFLLISGVKTVGKLCEKIVPFMLIFYFLASLGVIIFNADKLSNALYMIFKGAFNPSAVTGGVICSLIITLRTGIIRGIVSNEAGLGTATLAHSATETENFNHEAQFGIGEVFIDTFICTLTAFVILLGCKKINFGFDSGSRLILDAFYNTYGGIADGILSAFLILFGISSVLGWGAYGIVCCEFLTGYKGTYLYKVIFSAACIPAAILTVEKIWTVSELLNSVMSIPNVIAVFLLSDKVIINHQKKL